MPLDRICGSWIAKRIRNPAEVGFVDPTCKAHAENDTKFIYLYSASEAAKRPIQADCLAIEHRIAGLSYSYSSQLLFQHSLQIFGKFFYNAVGSDGASQIVTVQDRIDHLLLALQGAGLHVRTQCSERLAGTNKLETLTLQRFLFMSPHQNPWVQQFLSGFINDLNAIFRTNSLRMPLCNIVGVTNAGKTFVVFLSFSKDESNGVFESVFKSVSSIFSVYNGARH